MTGSAQEPLALLAREGAPRILFVLGKGGVGRSTVAAAIGALLAAHGERTLVLQWALGDSIGPWFGVPPAGFAPAEVAPRLSVCNFVLEEALRSYFVDHLRVARIYRHVIQAGPVTRLIEIAPGLAEMFFLGELWWLTTLAEREAGLCFDRIVVDAPATGHGTSLLDVPAMLATMGAAGLLALETRRVVDLMADPARTGALVVSLPEPLVMEETEELVPRVTSCLRRPPLGVLVNRSARGIVDPVGPPGSSDWLDELDANPALSPPSREALRSLHDEAQARVAAEVALAQALQGATRSGVTSLAELPGRTPLQVVQGLARQLEGPS